MKSILLSIKPKYCELIANGKKTIEVRKTRPKLETPFKCYIYCTKAYHRFMHGGIVETLDDLYRMPNGEIKYGYSGELMCCGEPYYEDNFLNSKVIGEFVCDCILSHCEMANADIAEQQGCIRRENLIEYANEKNIYGWHISDLVIYNKAKRLDNFRKVKKCHRGKLREGCIGCWDCEITRPPQSWCYVDELE